MANEDFNAVVIFDDEGYDVNFVSIERPIGLAYAPAHNLVFISSKAGRVAAFDADLLYEGYYHMPLIYQ